MSLPEPLTNANLDVRLMPYMPLDVVRLRDSDIAALASGDAFRAAVLLWCACWHQVPAASLPADAANLARYAGYGRDIKGWLKVKDDALRNFVECSDGRLYHPVIAEKAIDADKKRRTFIVRASKGGKAKSRRQAVLEASDEHHTSTDPDVLESAKCKVSVSKEVERNLSLTSEPRETESALTPAAALAHQFFITIGVDPQAPELSGMAGVAHYCAMWLERGYDRSLILATAAEVKSRDGPLKPLTYFAKAIENAHVTGPPKPAEKTDATDRGGGFKGALARLGERANELERSALLEGGEDAPRLLSHG